VKQVQNLLNSGTFLKRDGKWQVVNWQSTRMPRTEEENRADVAATTSAFRHALLNTDGKRISALTDASFVWTQGKSELSRKQVLDAMTEASSNVPEQDKPNEVISLYGETAVVRGVSRAGKYTMTLVNQGGAWKIVALHSAG
jgi:hypothetical protein